MGDRISLGSLPITGIETLNGKLLDWDPNCKGHGTNSIRGLKGAAVRGASCQMHQVG
jgi:hypothetical protein